MKRLALAIALAVGASPASAALTLDQSAIVLPIGPTSVVQRIGRVPPPPSNPTAPPVFQTAVQTFTAASSGKLSLLTFQGAGLGPSAGLLLMSLIDGDYAAGARDVLLTQGVSFSSLIPLSVARTVGPQLFFDTSAADFMVQAGTRYSVLFEAVIGPGNDFAGLIIGSATPPPAPPTFFRTDYAGGALYGIFNGNLAAASTFDVGFESFVEATAIPEPTSWALMILGFGAAGAAARRQPRRALA